MPPWNTGAGNPARICRERALIEGHGLSYYDKARSRLAFCFRRGQVRTESGGSGQRPVSKFRVAVRLPFLKGKEDPERSGLWLSIT